MNLLNLGCGTRYIKEWTNIDFIKTGPEVIAYNFLQKIPFDTTEFDVVYHSHVLEHFSKEDGENFCKECYRVLKPGGIIRIAVPDLERIVNEYLNSLDGALRGNTESENNYEWIMLEMYDQAVRNKSGGKMLEYWQQQVIANEKYVAERLGNEFTTAREKIKAGNHANSTTQTGKATVKEKLIAWLAGDKNAPAYLQLGKFRSGGEIHQWMYDRYSLSRLLTAAGFKNVHHVDAFSSLIPDWDKHQWLDVEDGRTRKPDSLFMEAKK